MGHAELASSVVGRTGHRFAARLMVLLLAACAGGPPPRAVAPPAPAPATARVPAGVDSGVAARADSIAEVSFVPVERQEQAATLQATGRDLLKRSDSLWQAFAQRAEGGGPVAPGDSARAREAAAAGGRALVALDQLLRTSGLEATALAAQTALLLDSAEVALEVSFRLNPFDERSQLWLSRVYELQARRLGKAEAYQRAVDALEKLTALTPDQHGAFAMLANNHFQLQQWGPAARHYQEAERVYRETHDLVAEGKPVLDSVVLYGYIRAQADVYLRQRDAGRAEAAFRRALAHAPAPEDSSYVQGEIEWMAWDGGNIASSFARDSLAEVERQGDLAGARAGYGRLRAQVRTPRAIDEVEWRLAIVDYNLGQTDAAAERLQALVARTPRDSSGGAADPRGARYLDDYGSICLNLGRAYLRERRDNRNALKYFEQAARLSWSGRAVAHLEIATLLQGNTALALDYAGQALTREATLTVDQRRTLYRLLMGLHRRSGDFDKARRFRDALRGLPPGS